MNRRTFRFARISAGATLLFILPSCGAPANNDSLFSGGGRQGGSGSAGTAAAAGGNTSGGQNGTGGHGGSNTAGTTSGGSAHGGSASGGATTGGAGNAGGTDSGGATTGGVAGASGTAGDSSGGDATGGSGGVVDVGGSGGATGGSGGMAVDCTTHDPDAKYLAATGHCYYSNTTTLNFGAAQDYCTNRGAHLVTIATQAENDFVWSLNPNTHWIGATDGRSRMTAGVGTYAWVTNEPFSFTNWSDGQPNATASTCTGAPGKCYEHCAFQWGGGSAPGQWNDRLCELGTPSVCEWDE